MTRLAADVDYRGHRSTRPSGKPGRFLATMRRLFENFLQFLVFLREEKWWWLLPLAVILLLLVAALLVGGGGAIAPHMYPGG